MTQTTYSDLEIEYSKEQQKLALLAQRVQIAKDEEYLGKKKIEAGDVEGRLQMAQKEASEASEKYTALKIVHDQRDRDWLSQADKAQEQLARAQKSDEPSEIIVALEAKIEVAKERPAVLQGQVEVLKCLSSVRMKDAEYEQILQKKTMVEGMESALASLQQSFAQSESNFQNQWGVSKDANMDQEILELKVQLKAANEALQNCRASSHALQVQHKKEVSAMKPFYEDGLAIRLRHVVWSVGSCQDPRLMIMGDRASHYGSALSDAILITTRADFKNPMYQTQYFYDYGFYPCPVITLQASKKFLEILDWRGGMFHFLKSAAYNTSKFQSTLKQAMTLSPVAECFSNNSKSVSEACIEALIIYLDTNEYAISAYEEMGKEYRTALNKHKKSKSWEK